MAVLDIVVAHYNEPYSVYGKFFQMLNLQRGVDFNDIHVILVNDGEDQIYFGDVFGETEYTLEQHVIPKSGISAVRNFGLRQATSEWICFCDCDDCFSTVYSLKLVLDVLKNHDISKNYDMFWNEICAEDADGKGGIKLIYRDKMNLVFIHGKFYRRKFLLDNDIWFPEDLEFNEDSAFNSIANVYWDYKRTAGIRTSFPLYSWCYREGSLTTTPENLDKALLGSYERNKKVCEIFKEKMPFDRYCAMIARTVFDAYYVLNVQTITPIRAEILEDFKSFYKDHKEQFWSCSNSTLKEIKGVSKAEHELGRQEEAIRWPGYKYNACKEEISVTKWLASLED